MRKGTDGAGAGPVSGRERAGMFWRSLFLQAAWNPRGMQNVGFCFALMPLLRRCGDSADARRAFLKRHLAFFNTNPTLASYAIGAAAECEVGDEDEAKIAAVKKGLSSLLGMSGDALMWWALRPLAGVVAVLLALEGSPWAPVVLVALYGVPHLVLKGRGISVGVRRREIGAGEAVGRRFRRVVRSARAAAAFCAGLVLARAATAESGSPEAWRIVVLFGFLGLAYVAHRVRVPATVMGLGGAAGGVVLLLAGLNGG